MNLADFRWITGSVVDSNSSNTSYVHSHNMMDTFHHLSSSKFWQQSVTFCVLLFATDVLFTHVKCFFVFINRLAAPKLHATVITEQVWTITLLSSAILLKKLGFWVDLHASRDKCLRLCQRQSLGSRTRHVGDLVGDPKVLVGSGPVPSGQVRSLQWNLALIVYYYGMTPYSAPCPQ